VPDLRRPLDLDSSAVAELPGPPVGRGEPVGHVRVVAIAGRRRDRPRRCPQVRHSAVAAITGTADEPRHRRGRHHHAERFARRHRPRCGQGRKHILVEKPMALDAASAETMVRAAEDGGSC